MSGSEVNDKFRALFAGYGTRKQADSIIALIDRLEHVEDVGELFSSFD